MFEKKLTCDGPEQITEKKGILKAQALSRAKTLRFELRSTMPKVHTNVKNVRRSFLQTYFYLHSFKKREKNKQSNYLRVRQESMVKVYIMRVVVVFFL